jgi:hypothetical protein
MHWSALSDAGPHDNGCAAAFLREIDDLSVVISAEVDGFAGIVSQLVQVGVSNAYGLIALRGEGAELN